MRKIFSSFLSSIRKVFSRKFKKNIDSVELNRDDMPFDNADIDEVLTEVRWL